MDASSCEPAKKIKLSEEAAHEENTDRNLESVHGSLKNLSTFKLDRILSNKTNQKTACLVGTFEGRPENAVIILEKTSFASETLTDGEYFGRESKLDQTFHNDIYGNYTFIPVKDNGIKTTIIHPATESHINKFSEQDILIVEETPKLYQDITLPHITNESFSLNWVYNILEHKSETDRIVFEDPDPEQGFILLPDLKWNGNVDSLYLLAICHKRDIKSIRDLSGSHLGLLRNILTAGKKVIRSKYGLPGGRLRIYVHYQPSFYHFHVHFTNLKHDAPGILTERAHLLSTVINNIQLSSDYYQKATLPFTVRSNDRLYQKLIEANAIENDK